MLEISIPGHQDLRLAHLVLDYNGTVACDGKLIPPVRQSLEVLAESLQIHVLTADTFGKAQSNLLEVPCRCVVVARDEQHLGKLAYVEQLGAQSTVCIGNGRNDRLMLARAALGIGVVQQEGAAAETLSAADVVCPSIASALGLLTNPLRLVATLRS